MNLDLVEAVAPYRGRRRRELNHPPAAVQVLSLLAGVILWELVFGYLVHVNYIPPVSTILQKTVAIWNSGELAPAVQHSVYVLVIGFIISAVGGVALGLAMAYLPLLERMLNVYVTALIVSPSIILGPVFFVVFALSPATIISIVVVSSFPYITFGTRNAFRQTPVQLEEMARCFGARRLSVFTWVTVRAALPLLMTALRLGMGRAVKGMFLGQLVVTVVDLGHIALQFQGAFDSAGALSLGFVVILIAVVGTGLVDVVDRRVNWWV